MGSQGAPWGLNMDLSLIWSSLTRIFYSHRIASGPNNRRAGEYWRHWGPERWPMGPTGVCPHLGRNCCSKSWNSDLTDHSLCCPLPPSPMGHLRLTELSGLAHRLRSGRTLSPLWLRKHRLPSGLTPRICSAAHHVPRCLPWIDSLKPSPGIMKAGKNPWLLLFLHLWTNMCHHVLVLVSSRERAVRIFLTPPRVSGLSTFHFPIVF